ncbi:MAG: nucleotidyltransferase domain-containing protein [Candidatus Omnitrophota bacterium]|nr:MAG: nucleotidyltransferase domain-containing protein [Candidatus Omnitrophota bacterium]RKY43965.1 MAG: nucleotidyltransferase domain-containing protein [Candidatus Omnitrophota bacterium]
MEKINLSEQVIEDIIKIITNYKEVEKIVIFGSRATNNSKNTSDIDVAIFAKNWTDKDLNIVKFNLDEYIKTPLKFDLLNFYEIEKESLKENILRDGRIIYEKRKD